LALKQGSLKLNSRRKNNKIAKKHKGRKKKERLAASQEEERQRQAALAEERAKAALKEKELERRRQEAAIKEKELEHARQEEEMEEEKRRLEEEREKKKQQEIEAARKEKERLARIEDEKKRKKEQLKRDLLSTDPEIRCAALRIVAKSDKYKQAIPGLVELLGKEQVRNDAAEALVKIGRAAVPALIEVLDDKNLYVRYKAAQTLGRIQDKRALAGLRKLRDNDSSALVRGAATKAIASIKD